MNKMSSKSYIIPPLELTLDYIVLDYCLLDTTSFTYAENNFIGVTSLCDRMRAATNINALLNQSHEKNMPISTMRRRFREACLERQT